MNRFAELLDRLAYEPGRNAKFSSSPTTCAPPAIPSAAGRWRR